MAARHLKLVSPAPEQDVWAFGLDEPVYVRENGQHGVVIARTEWTDTCEDYIVRLPTADAKRVVFSSFDLAPQHGNWPPDAHSDDWKFRMGAAVSLGGGKLRGLVIARTEWVDGREDYRVRFMAPTGDLVETNQRSFNLHTIDGGVTQ